MNEMNQRLDEKRINNVKQINPKLKRFIVSCINFIGSILFFYKRLKSPPRQINKVLFISLYFTGDIIMNSPVFDLVRNNFADAHCHIWIKSRAKDVINGYPYFTKIFVFDDVQTRRYDENIDNKFKNKVAFFKKLRHEKYDMVIDLTGLFWTAFAVFFSNSKYSCGLNFQGFGFLYNFETKAIYKGHLIDKYLNVILNNNKFVRYIDITDLKRTPHFFINHESVERINKLFQQYNIDTQYPSISFHTTAGWNAKKWHIDNYLHLIEELNGWRRFNFFIIGDKGDSPNAKYLQKKSDANIFDFTNSLNINESAEIIKRSDLFIGCDSGPLYIAESLNTPTIGLFGPTNPMYSAPRVGNNKVFYEKLFCSAPEHEQNCVLQAGLNCKTHDCMKMIQVSEIVNYIKNKCEQQRSY